MNEVEAIVPVGRTSRNDTNDGNLESCHCFTVTSVLNQSLFNLYGIRNSTFSIHSNCRLPSCPNMEIPPHDGGQESPLPTFHRWPQNLAQTELIEVLMPYLPHSNPILNRILAPQNTSARHCLFGATFPPGVKRTPSTFTILFADRSRHHEAQIWLFNPLSTKSKLESAESDLLRGHIASTINFLRSTPIPEAPGWPFQPLLKFGCLPTLVADAVVSLAGRYHAVKHDTNWTHYLIPLQQKSSLPTLPAAITAVSPVPHDQLDLVTSTSSIPRQQETLKGLPSVGLLDHEGKLIAWAFVDVDGSLATLYVVPEHRKKGLARTVAKLLLEKLHTGDFKILVDGVQKREGNEAFRPFGIGSQWIHTEVKEGNVGSEKVVESLGGTKCGFSRYTFVDGDLMPTF